MNIEQFKLDWVNLPKSKILELYPEKTYSQLKDMASYYKVKKSQELICMQKLKKLLEDNLYNWYWYGFIIGDGHISEEGEIRIVLNIKDINHLEKLGNYLNIKVIKHNKTNYCYSYQSGQTCYLGVKDSTYGIELHKKFQITNPKTYNPCSLTSIKTDEQFLAFLTGYIDADGYIGNKKDRMIRIQNHKSWLPNLEYFARRLKTLGVDSVKTKVDNRGYANFIIYKQHNFKFLYDFVKLYNLPVLERKWSKLDYLYNLNS